MQKRKCLIASVLVLCLLLASMCCAVSEDTAQGMRIEDGMARQIVSYTSAQSMDYSNADSEILRLVVYVETDYDTDLDGKPDLIKAVVQVPRPPQRVFTGPRSSMRQGRISQGLTCISLLSPLPAQHRLTPIR
ncbi:MAG: hypothetical protein IJL96_06570 [Clostridia bacterium]|nr:hypothetical protein [Clostridia bacterium]